MNRAYVFRIYPNRAQKEMLEKTFGCVRLVYNHYLDRKKQLWLERRQSMSYKDCAKDLTGLKKEKTFLREVDSIALQQSLRHLDDAFRNFFRNGKTGYPKFKSKRSSRRSYSTVCVNGNIRLSDKKIRLPKLGEVKIRQHRSIPEGWTLRSVTVKQSAGGKYFVSILFEYENQVIRKEPEKTAGLDFSMPGLFVSSDGYSAGYPQFYRKSEKRLALQQRRLSKMEKGSSNYRKQKRIVAREHEKTANRRRDFLHKESHRLAQMYDVICIEDLDMREMSGEQRFGKSVHDAGWGEFCRMLDYKLRDRGGQLIRIDKWYPSSQICSCCGSIHPEVKDLSIREWFCDHCLEHHDRDINAAINIEREGRRLLSA